MKASVAPSGARTGMMITPRSSSGASSDLVWVNSHQLAPAEAAITNSTTQRTPSTQDNAFW